MDKVVRIECTVKAASDNHAKSIFRLASSRLLNVHDWIRLSDCLLSASEHRDFYGAEVTRVVKTDDYIGLTNQSLRPFGWMKVLFVTENELADGGEVTLLAKPVQIPFEAENETQTDAKPTMLSVARQGLDVTAAFITEVNPLSTVFERLGVYTVQWRSLVNGILSDLMNLDEQELVEAVGTETRFT
jgi:hypothetical protein